MKIKVCVRCHKWSTNLIDLKEEEKSAVMTLTTIGLLEAEYDNYVCTRCRVGIGDKVSDTLLKIFNDVKKK